MESWAKEKHIELLHIQPGKPAQNAYIERFNRTYREDVLDAYLFDDLQEVRHITERWLEDYNTIRPHEALQGLTTPPVCTPTCLDLSTINKKTLQMQEFSVVNGCQTTMCIVGYAEENNEVYVTAKVVGTNQAWDVARAANLQNDVSRFELEIAQFLRPQVVNKAASNEGYKVIGNESAFTLLDSIYQYEVMYEDLRGLFVGIFSNSPNNIFDTNYLDLLPEVISKFYRK